MKDSSALKKLQSIELEILLTVSDFCKTHGISWFMDAGTLLGAARHSGFIPWDDDIDIGMLRQDYDRFVDLAQHGLPDGYELQTFENNEVFAGHFAKVCKTGTEFRTKETAEAGNRQGIFIDIFPYDTLAEDATVRSRQQKRSCLWQSLSYLYHAKTITVPHKGVLGAVERFGCRVCHVLVRTFFTRARIAQGSERARYASVPQSSECKILAWAPMGPCPVDGLIRTSSVSFCGHNLSAPLDYEAHLSNMYGDWRTLPAPEDRRTHLPQLIDFGDGTLWCEEDRHGA